jgi:hypothetical protein
MSRHVVVLRGTAKRVHARRGRVRRRYGVHAPVPGFECRGDAAVVATRCLSARADANASPPIVAGRVAARALATHGVRPARGRDRHPICIKIRPLANFYTRSGGHGVVVGYAVGGSWRMSTFIQCLLKSNRRNALRHPPFPETRRASFPAPGLRPGGSASRHRVPWMNALRNHL